MMMISELPVFGYVLFVVGVLTWFFTSVIIYKELESHKHRSLNYLAFVPGLRILLVIDEINFHLGWTISVAALLFLSVVMGYFGILFYGVLRLIVGIIWYNYSLEKYPDKAPSVLGGLGFLGTFWVALFLYVKQYKEVKHPLAA